MYSDDDYDDGCGGVRSAEELGREGLAGVRVLGALTPGSPWFGSVH